MARVANGGLKPTLQLAHNPRDRQTAGWRCNLFGMHFIPAKSDKPLNEALSPPNRQPLRVGEQASRKLSGGEFRLRTGGAPDWRSRGVPSSPAPRHMPLQHVHGIYPDLFHRIAALHHIDRGQAHLAQHLAIISEIIRCQLEETDRIALEGIHAQRHHQQLGRIGLNARDRVFQRSFPRRVGRSGRHRIIHRTPGAGRRTGFLGMAQKMWKGLHRIAVQ